MIKMFNLSEEFNKIKVFRDNQDLILNKFKRSIKYSDIVSLFIPNESLINIEEKKENSYHLPVKRKHLLRFIHSDKVKNLSVSYSEMEKIKECELEIISNSLNITLSLQLLYKNVENETFNRICNRLKIKESDIRYLLGNIDDTIPKISNDLERLISYYNTTVSLKSSISTIISSIVISYRNFIMIYWNNISSRHSFVVLSKYKKEENIKMQSEEYYNEYLLYELYLKDNNITIGEIMESSNNDKFRMVLNDCRKNTPFIYQYLIKSTIYSYYSCNDIEEISNLEYSRFLNEKM